MPCWENLASTVIEVVHRLYSWIGVLIAMFPWQCAYSTFWSFATQSGVSSSLLPPSTLAPLFFSLPSSFPFSSLPFSQLRLSHSTYLLLLPLICFQSSNLYMAISPQPEYFNFLCLFFNIIFVYLFLSISGAFYLYCTSPHHSCCWWFEPCGHHRCYSAFTSFLCLVSCYLVLNSNHKMSSTFKLSFTYWVLHSSENIFTDISKSMSPRWFLIQSNWWRRLTVRGLSTLIVYCIKFLLLGSKPIWESTYFDLHTHSHSHLSTYIISKNSKHKTWSEETWKVSRTFSPRYCREKQQKQQNKQHHKKSRRNISEGI